MALPTQKQDGALTARKELYNALEKFGSQITQALPAHMNQDRMIRVALTEFSKNPKLFECSKESILGSIIQAAQLGLEPGVNGQAYLVPYGKTCQFIPGWRGLMDLLARTGRASAWTDVVRKGDVFKVVKGTAPSINHEPNFDDDTAEITHFYAVGHVNGADYPVFEVWSVKKIQEHLAKYNKVGGAHYAHKHFEMYGRKVVLLQVLKYMPMSVELNRAIEQNDRAEIGDMNGEFINVQPMNEEGEVPLN